jgi:hypothetical protein
VALAVGNIIQIIDTQTYLGQEVLNVYHYRCTAVSPTPTDPYGNLLDMFDADVVENVAEIQMSNLLHVSREARNLSNGLDFAINSSVIPGGMSTDTHQELNSFTSAGFLLQRSSLATRNGYKRVGGLSETDVVGNDWVGETTRLDDIEGAFAMTITAELGVTFQPIILKAGSDPLTTDPIYSNIATASFRGIGTQNSRKPGRGV